MTRNVYEDRGHDEKKHELQTVMGTIIQNGKVKSIQKAIKSLDQKTLHYFQPMKFILHKCFDEVKFTIGGIII
jgi:hypothetical protein